MMKARVRQPLKGKFILHEAGADSKQEGTAAFQGQVTLAVIREIRRKAVFPIIQTQPKVLSLVYAEKF